MAEAARIKLGINGHIALNVQASYGCFGSVTTKNYVVKITGVNHDRTTPIEIDRRRIILESALHLKSARHVESMAAAFQFGRSTDGDITPNAQCVGSNKLGCSRHDNIVADGSGSGLHGFGTTTRQQQISVVYSSDYLVAAVVFNVAGTIEDGNRIIGRNRTRSANS
ncbi:MAG: hypothetical protein BWX77_00889 [Bacteroidetes bacterium ADurb.Bin090]|nr:MAG: hypothetical protein BWX77_00889 [Bacteroidetes bacterium ADurb.Bin090]